MFILNKKRIYIIVTCLIISGLLFQFQTVIKKEDITVETVALPVNNKIVVLDAGHGVPDERSGEYKRNI